jgi:hypothetical protein
MSQQFNKYQFLRDLEDEIRGEIENGNITDREQIEEHIQSSIDNACIYYSDCFDICKELNATDFTDYEMFGEIKSINQLAYAALYEYVFDEYDIDEAEQLIMDKEAE